MLKFAKTWLKRAVIGFGVAIGLLAALSFGVLLSERHRIAQFNRTHDNPLEVNDGNLVLAKAHRLMRHVEPFEGTNSLHFAAMPSFGDRWFAVALWQSGNLGQGKIAVEDRRSGTVTVRTLTLPRQDFDRMMSKWDRLTDGYGGEGRSLADGTPLAFERRRGHLFTSGVGNSPCHYDVLGDMSAQVLEQFVPELSDLREPNLQSYLESEC
jgi:hypothetical protein